MNFFEVPTVVQEIFHDLVKVRKESNYSSLNYNSVSSWILLRQRLRFSKHMINEVSIDE